MAESQFDTSEATRGLAMTKRRAPGGRPYINGNGAVVEVTVSYGLYRAFASRAVTFELGVYSHSLRALNALKLGPSNLAGL